MGGTYAGILGLVAFATTLARSLIHGGGTESTLKVAVINLFLFSAIGLLLGRTAEWTIEDALRYRLRLKSKHDGNPAAISAKIEP